MAKSSLFICPFQNRFKNLVQFVVDWDESDLSTLNGLNPNCRAVIQVHQIHTSDASSHSVGISRRHAGTLCGHAAAPGALGWPLK